MSKENIAFVVVRYGLNINGGAEYHCRMLAERLTNDYNVEVLTTCVDNYRTGENLEFKEKEIINKVIVRRFKTNPTHPELENFYKKKAKPAYKLRRFLYKCHFLAIASYFFPIWHFKEKEEPYKVELIEDLPEDETISFYSQGEFTDLCAGPHLMSTKYVKAFKLTSLAGAYWRGSEKNKMLQRIYGTAFPKKAELEEYLNMLEEAKKRDEEKIMRDLERKREYRRKNG